MTPGTAPIEKEPSGPCPPSHDANGVARMTAFRADLRQVFGAPLRMAQGCFGRQRQFGGLEATASLVSIPLSGLVECQLSGLEIVVMGRRQIVQVEIRDAVIAGVVPGSQKDRLSWNRQSPLGQPFAHPRIVQDSGKGPSIGASAPPPQAPQS